MLEIQAADKVPEDGGDEGRPGAAGQEPEDAAGDRRQTLMVGDRVEESPEIGAVGQGNDLGRGRESDGGFRPGQEPCRLEPAEGFPEPFGG
ncbi:MAG TPA: hypothetical protein VJY15_09370 [Candidatus Acidoferrum sp.]|nr:hypothetical protein [Candidatus Acidoferrum sp.]